MRRVRKHDDHNWVYALALIMTAASALVAAKPAPPPHCRDTATCDPRIVYMVDLARGGNEIRVTNADGSGSSAIVRLPDGGGYGPSWGPDGSAIAFATTEGIYIQEINRSTSTPIGLPVEVASYDPQFGLSIRPNWRTDQTILFTASGTSTPPYDEIYSIDLGSSQVSQLTANAGAFNYSYPSLSPDLKRIAAQEMSHASGLYALAIFTSTGALLQRELFQQGNVGDVSWAHTGAAIVFQISEITGTQPADIFCFDPDAGVLVNLTATPDTEERHPSFSVDDSQILFQACEPDACNSFPEGSIYKAALQYNDPGTDCPTGLLSKTRVITPARREGIFGLELY